VNLKLSKYVKCLGTMHPACLKLRDEEEHSDGNVEILKGVLEDFRGVADWDSVQLPTLDEWQVLIKMWQLTASTAHFFECTIAYEQRTHIIQQGGNHPCMSVCVLGRVCVDPNQLLFLSIVGLYF
jgi:hypothetical protein